MYKKYLSVSIMMLAPMCANAGGDYTAAIQQLDAEIARLQAQNQAGLEELQECEKKVKGFKISGITTLSLTGVGIGVNIGEAVKLNKLEKQSSALDASIAEKQAEIQRQKEEAAAAERERQAAEQKQEGVAEPVKQEEEQQQKEEAEPVKQEEEQKQKEAAEAQQKQSQQAVQIEDKSGDESVEKPAGNKTDEIKDNKKTSTPASKSGTQEVNKTSTTPKAAPVNNKEPEKVQTPAPKASKPVLKDVYVSDVFKDVQVNVSQGKALVRLWAQETGKGYVSCSDSYTSQGNDDVMICTTNDTKYHITFDDLNENFARTAHVSIARKVCEIKGGQQKTEPDTGLGNSIRCDLPRGAGVDCDILNPALKSFASMSAKRKDVYSTSTNGKTKTLFRSYCAITW